MTINVSQNGSTRVITDVQAVEAAFLAADFDPRYLDQAFIPFWLSKGKDIDEILVIAGEQPRARTAA